MSLRASLFPPALVLALCCGAANGQTASSPLGNWQSSTMMNRDWDVPATVKLTVTNVDAEQRASGRFVVYFPSGGGFPNYCRNGSVSGRFDGFALKLASEVSNLCAERVFDLKVDGDRLVGFYRGATGGPTDVTFTRDK